MEARANVKLIGWIAYVGEKIHRFIKTWEIVRNGKESCQCPWCTHKKHLQYIIYWLRYVPVPAETGLKFHA